MSALGYLPSNSGTSLAARPAAPPPRDVRRKFLSVIFLTGWPGIPQIEDARIAPVAEMSLIEMSWSEPQVGTCWERPRLPSRTKMGDWMSAITMFEIAIRSMLAPSTISRETPEVGARFHNSGRGNMAQLLTVMFLKSPHDSVPSLKQLQAVVSTQLVTVRCSVEPRRPSAKLALGTIESSQDSTQQLAMRTKRQQSGSIPSQ